MPERSTATSTCCARSRPRPRVSPAGRGWPANGRSERGSSRPLTVHAANVDRRMGTVYAIANQKGGAGKTTTAVNLADCIADAEYEVLLVDIDAQANATVGLGLPKDATPTLYEVLAGEASLEEAIRPTAIENLAVVPASPDLAGADGELPRVAGA